MTEIYPKILISGTFTPIPGTIVAEDTFAGIRGQNATLRSTSNAYGSSQLLVRVSLNGRVLGERRGSLQFRLPATAEYSVTLIFSP